MTTPRRIVLTRTAEQCQPWHQALEARGVKVLSLPLLRFLRLEVQTEVDTTGFDWILFTSPQGVRAFFDAELPHGTAQFGVLGEGTATALQDCGRNDHLGVRALDGSGLAQEFIKRVPSPVRVLLPGPAHRMDDPHATLSAAGYDAIELPLYQTDAVPASDLPASPWQPDDLIFFASPSAVHACVAVWEPNTPCIAIGETTAAAARLAGFKVAIADTPDLEAMIQAAGLATANSPKETS